MLVCIFALVHMKTTKLNRMIKIGSLKVTCVRYFVLLRHRSADHHFWNGHQNILSDPWDEGRYNNVLYVYMYMYICTLFMYILYRHIIIILYFKYMHVCSTHSCLTVLQTTKPKSLPLILCVCVCVCVCLLAFFRCCVCHETKSVEIDRGRIAEPAVCPNCQTLHSMELIHNQSLFTDKQMIKLQESPGIYITYIRTTKSLYTMHM